MADGKFERPIVHRDRRVRIRDVVNRDRDGRALRGCAAVVASHGDELMVPDCKSVYRLRVRRRNVFSDLHGSVEELYFHHRAIAIRCSGFNVDDRPDDERHTVCRRRDRDCRRDDRARGSRERFREARADAVRIISAKPEDVVGRWREAENSGVDGYFADARRQIQHRLE